MVSSTQEKSSMSKSESWRIQPDLCAKCGKCRSVCPVFRETDDESMVARGRLALVDAVEQGEVSADSAVFRRAITSCIGCYRCVYECPNGIEVVDTVHGARRDMVNHRSLDRMVSLMLRRIVPNRTLYNTAMRIAAIAQKVLPRSSGPPLRHLPLMLMDGCRVPDVADRSFLKAVRGREFRADHETRRVAFFVGCMINYVYPAIGESLIRVLNRHGVTVVVPDKQVCCGTPALSVGDRVAAAELAGKNVKAFTDAGITDIITACASCTKTLKSEMNNMTGGTDWDKFVVRDATEYLAEIVPSIKGRLERRVTYHDPCHLRWGQDVRDEPRQLLSAVSIFHEMDGADNCCGFGGTFSMFHRGLSQQIAGRKAESIAAVDAETVATACPGCMLQLQTIIDQHNLGCDVRHIVEIIDAAESDTTDT